MIPAYNSYHEDLDQTDGRHLTDRLTSQDYINTEYQHCYHYIQYSHYNMVSLIILIITLVVPGLGGLHRDAGHDDNCVDNSRYGELKYNVTPQNICTHKVDHICMKKSEKICIPVVKEKCEVVTFVDCDNKPTVTTQRSDEIGNDYFAVKECKEDGVEVLEEERKIPVCTTVMKQQCDSTWMMVKVWDGNENCRNASWEDCILKDRMMTEEVPTYSCNNGDTLTYSSHAVKEIEVISYERTCQPRGIPVCTKMTAEECTTVEWEECKDVILERCNPLTLNTPYQIFHHILRCSIGNDVQEPNDNDF